MANYLHSRHFTLEEAQTLIRKVKPMTVQLVQLKKQLDEKGYNIHRHEFFGGSGPNGERFFPPELEQLVDILKKLEKLGILVKGIEQGLIDFPHLRSNGQEVYLCFKADETEIRFWHSVESGFAGRKSIKEL
ncbi:MAG: DUF2203 domain-containing protein [Ignavibacteriales bacterium]|nr:DUF2203 domain-containing protein [Ignavibacteriales bacterium]